MRLIVLGINGNIVQPCSKLVASLVISEAQYAVLEDNSDRMSVAIKTES